MDRIRNTVKLYIKCDYLLFTFQVAAKYDRQQRILCKTFSFYMSVIRDISLRIIALI